MKAVVQRSAEASVVVQEETVGQIKHGLVILLGVTQDDTEEDARYLASKIPHLRIFEDEEEKMNLSLKDVGGQMLSISQFTLYGDTRKGRRPNFMKAAKPEQASQLYEKFNELVENDGIHVETGQFGEMMDVRLTNSGPVTLIVDSKER
ncbi:putative D-aminoacyl-tRNA deacylase-like protein [Halobacillus andaensis]|uniref:D-aminoacyl-tRNA deacylase n=1 Tax=Halobacillus andaensis TaxID=1176239 RepID=A0A917EUN3_HALAA|nr:D-aminoacyl-tRNA deacylase [Halobacillus andaensis]MBP2002985.1 D-tyrosyl-tRNA(Tyr) deacylase [Halobacillus andaensis]GGF07133.1 putative D-aminoacyl-tRNA deacylase-like protein [Halobacillus andaensis]